MKRIIRGMYTVYYDDDIEKYVGSLELRLVAGNAIGDSSSCWGKRKKNLFYFRIRVNKNNILFHRYCYCKYHNISLEDIEGLVIHHKNGNQLDNTRHNLEAMTITEHARLSLLERNQKKASKKSPLLVA